jgi:hypothetical protein
MLNDVRNLLIYFIFDIAEKIEKNLYIFSFYINLIFFLLQTNT